MRSRVRCINSAGEGSCRCLTPELVFGQSGIRIACTKKVPQRFIHASRHPLDGLSYFTASTVLSAAFLVASPVFTAAFLVPFAVAFDASTVASPVLTAAFLVP